MAGQLEQFFSKYQRLSFKKNQLIISPDHNPGGIYFLKSGLVRQYSISAKGEELTLNIFKPFSFFPMGWVLNDQTPNFYFEAMSQTEIYKAPKADFLDFLKSHPDVVFDLMKRIYTGLDGLFMRMEYMMSGNAESKLITELLIYARRFGQKTDRGIVVDLKLTQKDLAALSGIARETVSRLIKSLHEKGLVSLNSQNLEIKDLDKLQELLFK